MEKVVKLIVNTKKDHTSLISFLCLSNISFWRRMSRLFAWRWIGLEYCKNLNNWTVCYVVGNSLLWKLSQKYSKNTAPFPLTNFFSRPYWERKAQRHSTRFNYSSFYGIRLYVERDLRVPSFSEEAQNTSFRSLRRICSRDSISQVCRTGGTLNEGQEELNEISWLEKQQQLDLDAPELVLWENMNWMKWSDSLFDRKYNWKR